MPELTGRLDTSPVYSPVNILKRNRLSLRDFVPDLCNTPNNLLRLLAILLQHLTQLAYKPVYVVEILLVARVLKHRSGHGGIVHIKGNVALVRPLPRGGRPGVHSCCYDSLCRPKIRTNVFARIAENLMLVFEGSIAGSQATAKREKGEAAVECNNGNISICNFGAGVRRDEVWIGR